GDEVYITEQCYTLVTQLAIRRPQFEFVYPIGILQKGLCIQAPSRRKGRKKTPLMALCKTRGAIVAEISFYQILLFVIIVKATEIRDHLGCCRGTTHHRVR